MWIWRERVLAMCAKWHARRVFAKFVDALHRPAEFQERAARHALAQVAGSDYAREFGLARVHSIEALRRAVPLQSYEDLRPWIDRVAAGNLRALFAPRRELLMFATSSGTTAAPKWIPVTPEFVKDYRRGWNAFGVKMLSDHERAFFRPILQSTGRMDAARAPSGVPVGAITGLLAQTQKRIVRDFYVGKPAVAHIQPPEARYYTLMRLGLHRDVAFAITANPATLIQMARVLNDHAECAIRDVRDGTLTGPVADAAAVRALGLPLPPADPQLARRLEALLHQHGCLRPAEYWRLEFLACWTGGSMGQYLDRLRAWYGPAPVRDLGLLASEGRVSVPLADHTPAGPLDVLNNMFEFIPAGRFDDAQPATLLPHELVEGHDYAVVLTNSAGLLRYRLDDIVRMRGWYGRTPVVEFLHRGGRVSSLAGEKLTEQQVVAAVQAACRALRVPEFDYLLAPVFDDPPYYRLNADEPPPVGLLERLDAELALQNEEYDSRRKTQRLGMLRWRRTAGGALHAMDQDLIRRRGASAEQYKRQCLLLEPAADEQLLPGAADATRAAPRDSARATGGL